MTEELARIKTYMGKLKQLGEGASQDQQRLKVFLRSSHCLPVSPLFHPSSARTAIASLVQRLGKLFTCP